MICQIVIRKSEGKRMKNMGMEGKMIKKLFIENWGVSI